MAQWIQKAWDKHRQFFLFCLVGAGNTIITLLVYRGLLWLQVPYLVASPVGYACGVAHGYLWNTAVVFRSRRNARNLAQFVAVNLVVLGVNTALMYLWVDLIHMPQFIAQIPTLCVTMPLNFLLNKFWTFRKAA